MPMLLIEKEMPRGDGEMFTVGYGDEGQGRGLGGWTFGTLSLGCSWQQQEWARTKQEYCCPRKLPYTLIAAEAR